MHLSQLTHPLINFHKINILKLDSATRLSLWPQMCGCSIGTENSALSFFHLLNHLFLYLFILFIYLFLHYYYYYYFLFHITDHLNHPIIIFMLKFFTTIIIIIIGFIKLFWPVCVSTTVDLFYKYMNWRHISNQIKLQVVINVAVHTEYSTIIYFFHCMRIFTIL